ncbi:MAG: hypothetical protein JKY45_07270 [Emcibacter sp.]|nr:hypothetical protein [Emcibacter sp.]
MAFDAPLLWVGERDRVQKRAQFDDRIRNLIALAQDGSEHSRTLLFSHISDLFLQKRPMASAVQIRMLTEILKELLDQVALSTRQEIASTLYALPTPPAELINIMCEDVVEVSGPLLEKAILPDEKLIHIIRYGTEPHRIHISRRFGLSPLVRHELEKAYRESESSTLKYSLNELDKLAEDDTPILDEETTANILELLRAQNIHKNYPEQPHVTPPAENTNEESSPLPELSAEDIIAAAEEITAYKRAAATVEHSQENHLHLAEISFKKPEVKTKKDTPKNKQTDISHDTNKDSGKDFGNSFPTEIAANDATLPNSHIRIANSAQQMDDDIWQQAQDARRETNKQREFVRTVADWFWEVDRTGSIAFISEEAFTVFGRTSPALVGEDFISLCTAAKIENDNDESENTLESLFEHRASFRNAPFYISSQNEEKSLWYISAIAIFDIHTGRFTGFRGSARAEVSEDHLSVTAATEETHPKTELTGQKEEALEGYITTQALKAVTQNVPLHNTQAVTQQILAEAPLAQEPQVHVSLAQDMPAPEIPNPDISAQNISSEEVAAELLQNLSHEFRTPLNAIIGFSEMIDMETWGPVNPQYHNNIKNILTAAAQLKEAVNDVLDSAKLEAGLLEIAPESFSLKSILKNCRENVAVMALEKEVQLLDTDNNIDVILYNDKQSVELCLTKMMASTIRRASGNEIIGPSVLINSNAQVRIELPVLGPRIEEKNADILFQNLEIRPETKENMPQNEMKSELQISSGFGLSIAQKLAHMIGGDISIHSTQGYITHLVLTLSNHDPSS